MDCGAVKRSYILALFSIVNYNKNLNKIEDAKSGIPQAEQFWSHGTFLEPQILLESRQYLAVMISMVWETDTIGLNACHQQ
jgi:hypothetical protein